MVTRWPCPRRLSPDPVENDVVLHETSPGDAGVAHQDVEAPEPLDRRGDELLEVRTLSDVGGQHLRAATRGVDAFGQCVQPVGAPGSEHHGRAPSSEL